MKRIFSIRHRAGGFPEVRVFRASFPGPEPGRLPPHHLRPIIGEFIRRGKERVG
jgi:hypothetical protein